MMFGPFGYRGGSSVLDKLAEQLIDNAAKDLGDRLLAGKLTDEEHTALRSEVLARVTAVLRDGYDLKQNISKTFMEYLAKPETQEQMRKMFEDALPGLLQEIVRSQGTYIARDVLRGVTLAAAKAAKSKKGSSK